MLFFPFVMELNDQSMAELMYSSIYVSRGVLLV